MNEKCNYYIRRSRKSGKSTVRNALKEEFEKQGKTVVICSVGDIFRHLAEEKGMSIEEFNRYLQKSDCDIDKNIENTIKKFGDKIRNENDSDKIYIIDSEACLDGNSRFI